MKDLICYRMLSRVPFEIEEISIGTGAACGAIALEEGFEQLLRRKLRQHADEILQPSRLSGAKRHFEAFIKRQFNPDECDEESLELPLRGARDIPECGLQIGYLKLTKFHRPLSQLTIRAEVQGIFKPVFNQILNLVQQQLYAVEEDSRLRVKVK